LSLLSVLFNSLQLWMVLLLTGDPGISFLPSL